MANLRECYEAELRRRLQQIDALNKEVDALRTLLSGLENIDESAAAPSNGHSEIGIAPDEFAKMERLKCEALQKLLRKLGRAATVSECVELLERGGLQLYTSDPSRASRNLHITISSNSDTFGFNKSTDTVWLCSTELIGTR